MSWEYNETEARETIRLYMVGTLNVRSSRLNHIVGMIETGEVLMADVLHVGGEHLAGQVRECARRLEVEL